MDNKVKYVLKLVSILLVSVIVIVTGTFAYWTWNSENDKNVVFTTAGIDEYIVYEDGDSHFVGDFQAYGSFCESVNTTISIYKLEEAATMDLTASIFMDVNAIGDNIALSNDVYWVITEGDSTVTCDDGLTSGNVINSGTFNGKKSGDVITLAQNLEVTVEEKKYTVWIWIDSNGENLSSLSGETVDTNIWTQIDMIGGSSIMLSGDSSEPELESAGMIPVTFSNDGTATTILSTDSDWYDYTEQKWANALLVTSSSRSTYLNTTGVVVDEEDILGYYVWIPRFKYRIWTKKASKVGNEETIEVVFENATDDKSLGTKVGEFRTHPAFTFGIEELNGFWVGKFETTGDVTTPTVLPNTTALRGQNVSTQFATLLKIAGGNQNGVSVYFDGNSTYGLTSNFNSHMMKNSEWGAVAFLTHSLYGINKEVRINNNNTYTTGCGAATVNAGSTSSCDTAFGDSLIYPQSTTGNITGVFDMSGGVYEYVMGNFGNEFGSSGFSIMPSSKYYNLYSDEVFDKTSEKNVNLCTVDICSGHALYDTLNWYSDNKNFVYLDNPWFIRGGKYDGGAASGLFNFSYLTGASATDTSMRSVLFKTSYGAYYTVSYNANGGIGSIDSQIKTSDEALRLSSAVPTRKGYSFGTWNTVADGSGASYEKGGLYSTNANATLYAQWNANPLFFDSQTFNVTYSDTIATKAFTGASNGTDNYEYTISGGNDSNYFSINGTNITVDAYTPAGNYNITVTASDTDSKATKSVTFTINIAKKEITVNDYSVDYNQGTVFERTINTGLGSETLNLTYTAYAKNTGEYTYSATAGSGKYTLVIANGTGNVSNYIISKGKLIINPLELDVSKFTYSGLTKVYDGTTTAPTNFAITPTLDSGLLDGDTITISKTSAVYNSANVEEASAITASGMTIGGVDAVNYELSATSYSKTGASITKASILGDVEITGDTIYGSTLTANVTGLNPSDSTLSYQWWYSTSSTATSGTAINGATSSTYKIGSGLIGKYIGVTVTASKNSNYNNSVWNDISSIVTQKSIGSSDITVTLNPTTYTYDGNAKKPTVTVKEGSTTLTGINNLLPEISNGRYVAYSNFKLNYNTGSANDDADSMGIKFQFYNDSTYLSQPFVKSSAGKYTYTFTKDSTFNIIRLAMSGNNVDAYADFNVSNLTDGTSYTFSFNITRYDTYDVDIEEIMIYPTNSTASYVVSYMDNINASTTAKAQVIGLNDFNSSVINNFTINPQACVVTPGTTSSLSYPDTILGSIAYTITGDCTPTVTSGSTDVLFIGTVNETSAELIAQKNGTSVVTITANSNSTNYSSASATKSVTVNSGSYTVTANANGGTIPTTSGWTVASGNATATKSVTYNSTYGTLPTATRTGYTFDGWSLVPSDYKQIEYIQSTGTQYINTGVIGGAHWIFDIQFTNLTTRQLMGYGESGAEYWGVQTDGNYGLTSGLYMDVQAGNRDMVTHNYGENGKYYLSVNGTKIGIGVTDVSEKTYHLLGMSGNYLAYAKLYGVNTIQDGSVVRRFVPVKRLSDNAVGLYDTLNGGFYTNAGTGTFTAGNVQYITSTSKVSSVGNHTLYANWTIIPVSFADKSITMTYNSTNSQTASVTAATGGTGNFRYTEISEVDSSSDATSYISVSETGTITLSANTPSDTYTYKLAAIDTISGASDEATYTIIVDKIPGEISYGTTSVSKTYGDTAFTNTLTNTGDGPVSYSSSNTTVATVDSSTGVVTINQPGSATITATVEDGTNYTYAIKTASYSLTVDKKPVGAPTNLAVSTAGIVTFTAGSNTTGHQISIDGTNWTSFTSGSSYLSTIIASTGTRTIYVRGVNSDSTNNATPSSNATKSVSVFAVSFASNNTNWGTVNVSSKNVISGTTYSTSGAVFTLTGVTTGTTTTTIATVTATAKDNFSFNNWSSTSGTISSATSITANFKDNKAPNAPTVTAVDYNTFSYTAVDNVGVTGYYVSTSSTTPSASATGWVTTTSKDVTSAGTYYVWAKDAAGFVSDSGSIKVYSIKYNGNCSTTVSNVPSAQIKVHGATLTLSNNTPTCTGYTFLGWSVDKSATSYTWAKGASFVVNNDTTLYAVWKGNSVTITYNANGGEMGPTYLRFGEHEFTVPVTGSYKLELWGAQGGHSDYLLLTDSWFGQGGYGGYSTGTISLTEGDTLYVNVGGMGQTSIGGRTYTYGTGDEPFYLGNYANGGYNGGGDGNPINTTVTIRYIAGGGGATHIATVSGTLSSLSGNKDKILLVAGGGGGAYARTTTGYKVGGGHGGGYVGNNGSGVANYGTGGSQTAGGYANAMSTTGVGGFGFGGNTGNDFYGSAGGGGYYGGGGSGGVLDQSNSSGGGGSGYYSTNFNAGLTNVAMYCYNCTASTNTSYKTYSTTNVNGIPTSNYAKKDHGAAKIISLSSSESVTFGSSYGELITPSRYGYNFVGWNTSSDGTGTYVTKSSTVSTTSAHTLYAIWEKKCVTLMWSVDVETQGETYCYGDGTSGDFTPTWSGHTNKGWLVYLSGVNNECSLNNGCNGTKYELFSGVLSDFWINLYYDFGGVFDIIPIWTKN